MFTIEVARELSRRGNEVAVFCPHIGEPAELMYSGGVQVKNRLVDVPWRPDIIHGQHHLQAMAALSYFADVPAIYYCHGISPWVERVPIHPRIRTYVMMCEWMITPIKTEFDIPGDRIAAIANFVNTKRFSRVRTPPDRLRRAALFGNVGFGQEEQRRLQQACLENGMSLEKIGAEYGNPQPRPEILLPEYDLVFAIGKCALEALASGCAVIPLIPGQAGQLVNAESLDGWIYSNFSPRYYTSASTIGTDWLAAEINAYSPGRLSEVTARVRRDCDLTGAVDSLEKIYAGVIKNYEGTKPDLSREFGPYLEKLSLEVDAMWEGRFPEGSFVSTEHVQYPVAAPYHPTGWRKYAMGLFRWIKGTH